MTGNAINYKFKLWKCTPTAMIRDDKLHFGLGAPSICVEYHTRLAKALVYSLEDPPDRHHTVTRKLLTQQVTLLHEMASDFLAKRTETNLHIKRHLKFCMRACKLISTHSSKLHLMKQAQDLWFDEMKSVHMALLSREPPPHTLPLP
jgi:hypothetical protein